VLLKSAAMHSERSAIVRVLLTVLVVATGRSLLAQEPGDSLAWPWQHRENGTFIVTLVFSSDSASLLRGFVVPDGQPPCDSARAWLPDSTFRHRAEQFLKGVGWEFWYPDQQQLRRHGAEFVEVASHAGDFGAQVVFHKQGALVFVGTWVWDGGGSQLWPPLPLNPMVPAASRQLAPPFAQVFGSSSDNRLLTKVRQLAAIAALAKRGPYTASVFGWLESVPFGPVVPVVFVTSDGRTGVCPGH